MYDPSTYFRSLEGFKRSPQDRIMEITVDHTKSAVITAQLAQEQCKVLIDTGAAGCCIREDYYNKLSNAPLALLKNVRI